MLQVTTACGNISSVATHHWPSVAQHVRPEAVVDTACRLVEGDLLEPRGSVGDRLDQTRCCHVHAQRCHGDNRELRRLLNQLKAEVNELVHTDSLFVRHRWRGRQCVPISLLLGKLLNSFKLGNALHDTA